MNQVHLVFLDVNFRSGMLVEKMRDVPPKDKLHLIRWTLCAYADNEEEAENGFNRIELHVDLVKNRHYLMNEVFMDPRPFMKFYDGSILNTQQIANLFTKLKLWDSEEFVRKELNEISSVLEYTPMKFRKDKLIVLNEIQKCSDQFAYASQELKSDREFVKQACFVNRDAFRFASEELKLDRELILELLTKDASILNYVSAEIIQDQEFISKALELNEKVRNYLR